MVLRRTLRNQGFCKFVRALVWREVARWLLVLKMPFVARPCVVRDPMNELTIGRSFILLNQLYHYVN